MTGPSITCTTKKLTGYEPTRSRGQAAESPKAALKQATAARLARAQVEDRLDAAWLEQCRQLQCQAAKESGGPGPESPLAWMSAKLPPRPAGFGQRRDFCNRCDDPT